MDKPMVTRVAGIIVMGNSLPWLIAGLVLLIDLGSSPGFTGLPALGGALRMWLGGSLIVFALVVAARLLAMGSLVARIVVLSSQLVGTSMVCVGLGQPLTAVDYRVVFISPFTLGGTALVCLGMLAFSPYLSHDSSSCIATIIFMLGPIGFVLSMLLMPLLSEIGFSRNTLSLFLVFFGISWAVFGYVLATDGHTRERTGDDAPRRRDNANLVAISTVLLVAIVTAIIGINTIRLNHPGSAAAEILVVLAARDIVPFTRITPADLVMEARPLTALPSDAINRPEDVVGKVAVLRIGRGQIITASHLSPSDR